MNNNLDDGWDDFGDDFDVDDDDNDDGGGAAAATTVTAAAEQPPKQPPKQQQDGWDDDFFDEDDNDDALKEATKRVPKPTNHSQQKTDKVHGAVAAAAPDTTNAWEEDDLNFDDDNDEEEKPRDNNYHLPPPQQTKPPTKAPAASKTFQDLENYVQLLSHLSTSVNAVLETEYNTAQKAAEVLDYFTQRPGLVDYTIEKELPRMDYVVIQDDGMPLQDKAEIAAWMVQAGGAGGSLLPRCANQSLLADLLQAMTGPDMLIRPQFLATAIATSCRFVLDAPQESVLCNASLELTLPTEDGRWKVADLSVFCQLNVVSTQQPSILYRLDVVKPVERNDAWRTQLASAARLIESMELPEESFLNVSYQQSEDGMHYRDAFLQQSQTLIQNSAVGLRSALKEIDAVAGISNKLSKLPGFLPDDVMAAADLAHDQHPPLAVQENPQHRPTSILGGILSSGLSRLAQTVNLPEEDPEYYQNWQAQQQQQQQQQQHPVGPPQGHSPLFNRPPEPVVPRLYNRDEQAASRSPSQQTQPKPPVDVARAPQLYKRDTSPSLKPQPNVPTDVGRVPQLYKREPATNPLPPVNQFEARGPQQNHFETKPSEPKSGDGWEMDDDDIFSPDELAAMETKSPWGSETEQPQVRSTQNEATVDDGWVYDPETDIIPTRKRWINPRPGPRTLEYFLTGQ